ncbi:MAG: membrane protein insertion efficiency factor YidD [Cytophagales bacterium]|jgi:hypothetical protein|nr:membrane protein insertion efficiency factor YidD [Cytophagales bacterium]PDH41414.1 MAG: membrane protein insertion efficiency factor YidD [Rhodothermaeota bacterium MED-G19]
MNIKRLFILPIILYQKLISPILPNTCRFYPSCSEYSKQAILKYGVFYGIFLSFKRLIKCHPWGGHGNDPLK